MRVRYLNNNREDHVERNLGQSLIRAGIAVEVPTPKTPAPVRQFSIVIENYNDGRTLDKKVVAIRMDYGKTVAHYFGKPELINARKEWPGGGRYLNGFGCAVPDEIVREYAKVWKKNEDLRLPKEVLDPDNSCAENEKMAAAMKGK